MGRSPKGQWVQQGGGTVGTTQVVKAYEFRLFWFQIVYVLPPDLDMCNRFQRLDLQMILKPYKSFLRGTVPQPLALHLKAFLRELGMSWYSLSMKQSP